MTRLGKSVASVIVAALVASAICAPVAEARVVCSAANGLTGSVAKGSERSASDLPVRVFAEPRLRADMAVGDSVNLIDLASTRTDIAGCFHVTVTDAWAQAATKSGLLNLRIMVSHGTLTEMRLFPVKLTPSGSLTDLNGRPANLAVSGVSAVSTGVNAQTGEQTSLIRSADWSSAAPEGWGGSRWVLREDYGQRQVIVGQWWSTRTGVSQTWTYKRGAQSALGWAWSTTGKAGSFSASQEYADETESSVTFPKSKDGQDRFYKTYFKYGRYDLEMYEYTDNKWYYMGTAIRNTAWVAGTATADASTSLPKFVRSYCSSFVAGSKYSTKTSTALTWSNGVSVSAPMSALLGGVTLSSRTGFNVESRNEVSMSKAMGICGTFGDLSAPGSVAARKL